MTEQTKEKVLKALVSILMEDEAGPSEAPVCKDSPQKMEPGRRYFVDSSCIESLLWDELPRLDTERLSSTGILLVDFKGGNSYRLEGIHKALADAWYASESKGRFWHKWIKGRFTTYRFEVGRWVLVPRKGAGV